MGSQATTLDSATMLGVREVQMKDSVSKVKIVNQGPIGFIFFVAYVGAAVYFWHQASGFWEYVWALLKAVAWPAILVYHSMQAFHV